MKDYKLTEKIVNGKSVYEIGFTDGSNTYRCLEIDMGVYQIFRVFGNG